MKEGGRGEKPFWPFHYSDLSAFTSKCSTPQSMENRDQTKACTSSHMGALHVSSSSRRKGQPLSLFLGCAWLLFSIQCDHSMQQGAGETGALRVPSLKPPVQIQDTNIVPSITGSHVPAPYTWGAWEWALQLAEDFVKQRSWLLLVTEDGTDLYGRGCVLIMVSGFRSRLWDCILPAEGLRFSSQASGFRTSIAH